MMWSLAVFVAVSLCSVAHAQRSCLSLGSTAQAKCNFYEGDSAVCNIYCNNAYQGQYTSTNGGQYQPALPWCVTQSAQRKSCVVFNRGGYGQCNLYAGDSADCDIYCNNNYQGRYTATREGPYQPALPGCAYQPAYGPTPPPPGPRPRKCNLKLYYYSYAQCFYDNNSDSSYCDVSCNNQYAGRYNCDNGGFYYPTLPWCVDQVDKPTVQENPFPIKANQNSPKSQQPIGFASPGGAGGPANDAPVLTKKALAAPTAKKAPAIARKSLAAAPAHHVFTNQVKGSGFCLPPAVAPQAVAPQVVVPQVVVPEVVVPKVVVPRVVAPRAAATADDIDISISVDK